MVLRIEEPHILTSLIKRVMLWCWKAFCIIKYNPFINVKILMLDTTTTYMETNGHANWVGNLIFQLYVFRI